jgi:hypothetical protein
VAKSKPSTKKVITTRTEESATSNQSKGSVRYKPKSKKSKNTVATEMPFGKANYQFVILGAVLIAIGMALMSGGGMPAPDVWDESLIYSFRRITLAPIVILAGLAVEVYAIFRSE